MPQKNIFHKAVKNAFVKDGWQISDENFELNFDENSDLGSELLLLCEKDSEKIGVLVEHFLSASWMQDFYFALGRHLNCRFLLQEKEPSRILFSAVRTEDYENFIKNNFFEKTAKTQKMRMVLFDFQTENIKHWINYQKQKFRILSPRLANKEDAVLFEKIVEDFNL